MMLARAGAGCAAAALSALLVSPFLLVGSAGPSTAGAPTSVAAPLTPTAVAPGGGPWYVGGNVPPSVLPYAPPGGFPDTYVNPAGECTTWAAFLWPGHHQRGVTWSGDAWEWLVNAAAQGYPTSPAPSLGAIAVWPRDYIPGNDATQWGHVAIVIAVEAGSYTVTEMNVVGQFRVDTRVIPAPGNQAGFIPVPADAFVVVGAP